MLFSGINPSAAQAAAPDPDAAQVVGLFEQSCMRFAGNPAGLREWISAHHLPRLPAGQAALFLGRFGTGEAFGASTPSGKHALVSYDSGACQVVAMAGNAATVEQMLLGSLAKAGVSVAKTLVRSTPDGSSTQHLFDAHLGSRQWKLSIISNPHSDAPNLAPELHLLATAGAIQTTAEELVGSTSCADYLQMQSADTQPGADPAVARKHVTSLMHEYSKYILRGADGKPMPTIVDFIISYSTHYCQTHPTATVAEAGTAVGAAEQKAIADTKRK